MSSNPSNGLKNGSSRRNKFEIWSEILEACRYEDKTQSWLLRETRLKTSAIKEELQFLIKRNLLNQTNNPKYNTIGYLTTEKGKEALKQYYQLITKFFIPKRKKK